jgi:hypothetical protein
VRVHQELLLLLALFLSTRFSLLIVSRPQGYFYDASDYDFYLEFGRLSDLGLFPLLHYWTEYPPVFPWVAVAAYKAIAILPNLNGSPIIWFRLILGSILLVFEVGNLLLIYGLGRKMSTAAHGLRCAWIYALLFTPLHVWLGWFDTLPLFFLLLSLFFFTSGKSSSAAIIAGFGFMVKIFPLLTLPLLVKAERRFPHRIKLLALTAVSAFAVATPFLISAPEFLIASFRSIFSRSAWETPWAILEGYYGYGQVAPIQDRFDPSTAGFEAYPAELPWLAISAAFAILYFLIWTRHFDVRRGLTAITFAGLTVNLVLLYSKGYSPQFLVYVVPFAILVLPPFKAVGYLSVLALINLLEYPVYLALFRNQQWVLAHLVGLRTGILLLMAWDYLAILGLLPSLSSIRKVATTTALITFVLWVVTVLPSAGQEWIRTSVDHHPNARLIDYLLANADSDSVVIFSEQWLYRDLYPYLHKKTNLVLVPPIHEPRVASKTGAGGTSEPSSKPDASQQLAQLSERYREIFGVRHVDDLQGKQLEQLLAAQNQLTAARRIRDLAISRWSTIP